ncbi:MAG: LptF/LptG family permease [Elusimicrobia bacterium]|nr:LptF/LptG family permease [Elusimicrobiota bacterium]
MKIFQLYLLRKFFKTFFLATFGLLLLFAFSGIVARADVFAKHHTTLIQIFTFTILKSPQWLVEIIPVAILIGCVLTMSEIIRNKELLAIQTSGVNIWQVIAPFFIFGFVTSVLVYFFNDWVALDSTKKAYDYYTHIIKKRKPKKPYGKYFNVFLEKKLAKGRALFFIGFFDAEKNTGSNFSLLYEDASIKKEIFSPFFSYKNGRWILKNAQILIWDKELKPISFKEEKILKSNFKISPEEICIKEKPFVEMKTYELLNQIQKLKNLGIDSKKESTEVHRRFSFALSNLVVVFIGISFSIFLSFLGRIVSVVLSILLAFIYWGLFSFSIALGNTGILPPFISAWAVNFLFVLISAIVLLRKNLA